MANLKNKIGAEQIKFIGNNCETKTDEWIAIKIKASATCVGRYRRILFGVTKETKRLKLDLQKENARLELFALVNFDYSGVMKESLAARINFLSNLVQC